MNEKQIRKENEVPTTRQRIGAHPTAAVTLLNVGSAGTFAVRISRIPTVAPAMDVNAATVARVIAVHATVVRLIAVDAVFDPIPRTLFYPTLHLNNKIRPVTDNNRRVLQSMCTGDHVSSSPLIEILPE